jgi:hypothetical protein
MTNHLNYTPMAIMDSVRIFNSSSMFLLLPQGSSLNIPHATPSSIAFTDVMDCDPDLPIEGVEVEPFPTSDTDTYYIAYAIAYAIGRAKQVLRENPDEYLRRHGIELTSEKGRKLIAAAVALRMDVKKKIQDEEN